MIILPKFSSGGSPSTMGQSSAGTWARALLLGTFVAACSGTIETPTEEFPARQAADSTAVAPVTPAAPRTPAAPAPAPAPSNDDDDDDAPPPPAASDDDDEEAPPPEDEPEDEPAAPVGDVSFADDVWPIFNGKCGPTCHVSDGLGGQNVGSDDLDAALDDAVTFEAEVLEQLESGGMPLGCGAPPGGGALCVTEDEFATIEAWYDSGTPE